MSAEYFVFWNTIVKRVRIHRAACGACNNGAGMHRGRIEAGRGLTYDWEPAASYSEARALVTALMRTKPVLKKSKRVDCGLCNPGRGN